MNCKYVKRKQLSQYLAQETLDKYKGQRQSNVFGWKRKSDVVVPVSPENSIKKSKIIEEVHEGEVNIPNNLSQLFSE